MTNVETFRLLYALGINLRPSFSLDETGLIAAEGKEEIDFTAVGRPTANTEVRITGEGKLLVGGDGLFSGYFGNEAKTAAAMVDGWFNTGISADIDGKGQLVIARSSLVATPLPKIVPSTLMAGGRLGFMSFSK